jgi:hypothetical protein
MPNGRRGLDEQASDLLKVCLTLLGLLKAVEGLKRIEIFVDEMLALASLFFLFTMLLEYFGNRPSNKTPPAFTPVASRVTYGLGLFILAVSAVLLSFGVI